MCLHLLFYEALLLLQYLDDVPGILFEVRLSLAYTKVNLVGC